MSNVEIYVPLSEYVPATLWRHDLFTPADGNFLDKIAYDDGVISIENDSIYGSVALRVMTESVFQLPVGFALVLGHGPVNVDLQVGDEESLVTIQATVLKLRLPRTLFVPVLQDGDELKPDPDDTHFVDIPLQLTLSVDQDSNIDLIWPGETEGTLNLPRCMLGESGVIISADDIVIRLSRNQPLPNAAVQAGLADDWLGVFIHEAAIFLPKDLGQAVPSDLKFHDCLIGSGGFSGDVSADWSPAFSGTLMGSTFGLKHFALTLKQNTVTEADIRGAITLPFFDRPVDIEIGFASDGGLTVGIDSTTGLAHLDIPDVLELELDSLKFEVNAGVMTAIMSGKLTPMVLGFNWPSFDVRELSIDNKGHIHLEGGWIPLPKSYAIDFHGAKLEITQFGMGHTDDGGKYIGMSGKVKLVDGLPAGASVEGLRITWYDSGNTSVSFNGIGVNFKTPAVQFDGHVSYTQGVNEHRFTGDLKLVIPAANNLTLVGKAVFGKDAAGTKYFAIYIEGDFGTGIPLWATGLNLYGFAGLLAINYAPDKPANMAWYSINKSASWFHKPAKGVIDIVKKWKPERGAFALGAGVKIGTSDGGYTFNGNFLMLLLCPGPVLMIDGSARFLTKRDDTSEPPFHGLIVLDNRAGYFLVGLDARWKSDKSQGTLTDISGSMEVFFNYHDPTDSHLWLGKDDPMAQRIQARIAKVFTANAYFMLDPRHLKVGAWIGQAKHYKWGPVKADMEAWLAADADVSFKPPHLHVEIHLHGYLGVQVFRFKLGIGLDAILAADVFKPFHILGELDITIETRIKNFDIHMRLEWGPQLDHPDLQSQELLPVLNYGIAHPKSSIEWPLSDPAALLADPAGPLVSVDSRPYLTFGFPIHDAIGVGVNPSPPRWTMIGHPTRGGSARARYWLTKIELYQDGTLLAACPQPSPSVRKIFGSWAPAVPGTSDGQNKLMLWSMNPLDFTDNTDSWNPWLSSNLPGYPCPDTTLEIVCADFRRLDLRHQLYGAWWDPQKLDFRFDWSDLGPHPIVALSPAVQELDRGLLFSAPKPRKHYRAYVSNFGDNNVSLVDLITHKVIATIPAGLRPRQVALSPDQKRAYVCNQDDNTVVAIDTATNQRVGTPIAVIKSPVSIAIAQDGKQAFVPSGVDPAMSVIDLQSLQVRTVKLPAVANQAVLSPDGKKLYVMHGPAGSISIFDAGSLASIKTLAVAGGGPAAMVFHPSAPRAWISIPSRGTVRLFDTGSDEFAALETPTGKFARDLALSPEGARLYAGNLQDNTVSVLDTATLSVLATIATPSPAGLRMTPDGAALLVANYFANTVAVIDPIQNQVVAQGIAAGQGSNSFAVQEAPPQMLYRALVVHQVANAVSVLDLQTGKILTSIPVGRNPQGITLAPDGKRAYVSNADDNTVSVIDTVTNAIVGRPIPVASMPDSIAITTDGKRAFVMSGGEAKLSVIDLALSQATATVTLPDRGDRVILSADGKKGYAISGPANIVAAFSPATLAVTKVVAAPSGPRQMALHPRLARAFICFPTEGTVREFNTDTEQFTGVVVKTGAWAYDLCFSPDGSRLYVCNLHDNALSVIDTATNQVTATIPNISSPMTPVFTGDGSLLAVVSNIGSTVTMIDPVTNLPLGKPIPCPSFPNSLILQGTAQAEQPLPPVPVEVTIDVPAGSSSVEVTWLGKGRLHGTVSKPSAQMTEVVVSAGNSLKLDAIAAGLASQGINQIRLRSSSEWILIRVCATRLPFAGGLAQQQILNTAFNQQVALWQNPTVLLEPRRTYELRVDWSAEVEGMGDLNGWSDSFSRQTLLKFRTVLPPSLETVSDPRVPPSTVRPAASGLEDLSLYVRRTIPVTQIPKDEIPELTKPVFRGYDVTVEFNETYVDQMYQMAGRDLDLLLFDRNNQPVRDASGPLIIVDNAWDNAPKLVLTDTQARWIDMFNANTCKLQTIDPQLIPTSKMLLHASEAHVLAADTVYEARLVPQLTHQLAVPEATWIEASGAQIWNPPSGPADYRVSVLVTLKTSDPVGILFRYTNGTYYEFIINPGANRRQLTLVNGGRTTLAEDSYVYHPGTDHPYRIHIEAVGSQLLVSQNGAVVFAVTDTALPAGTVVPTGAVLLPKGTVLPTGTVGLRPPAGQSVFKDFGVSDLSAGAPVAYCFRFTASKFANFYHQIHSFQDEIWAQDLTSPLDLAAAVSSSAGGVLASATQPIPDGEIRAYDRLASLVLGSASAQNPPQVEVTRVGQGSAILGWLLCSPEPIDYTRTEITLSAANRILAHAEPPRAVKIAEAELGDAESVTVLIREATDLSGYCIQYRQMPSALADELGNQSLWKGGTGVAGDQAWRDYRASVVCRASQPGGIGLQFRYVDAQNFYAFTYDCVSGLQQLVKTVAGTAKVLKSTQGDPALGLPKAPPVKLAVSVQGSQIVGYRAGQKVVEASDNEFASGGAGVFSSGNPSAQFESFEVHRLPNELYALLQGQFSTSAVTNWENSTDGSGLKLKDVGNSSWTDVILRARVRRKSVGITGLLLRYQGPNNHYRLLFTDMDRRLVRVVQGVVTTLWSAPSPLLVDRVCEIAVSVIGKTLSVFQDAVLACEVADPFLASGSLGLCASPGADLAISQLVVYPPKLAFSNWTLRDEFQEFAANSWRLVDAGDQGGPSNWQVTNGRLTQTSAIQGSSSDPIRRRGTVALLKGSNSTGIRLVTRLLSQQQGAIGVVFGYRDADNFYRFSMDRGARYRRLVSCINGNMTVLWADSAAFNLGHDYVLTLDLIDDCVTAWLDGERVFQCGLSGEVTGLLGLYCSGNSGASFGDFRVGTPAWIIYSTFGHELPLSAGNRVKVASAKGVAAPNRRTSMRLAADLDDPAFDRLPPNGGRLRVVAADQTVQHGRECIPVTEFAKVPFQALRKGDGTGIILAPTSSIAQGQTVRLSFRYLRDNGIVAFTEVDESGAELVFIDLPTM